jgi:hypothetical protein
MAWTAIMSLWKRKPSSSTGSRSSETLKRANAPTASTSGPTSRASGLKASERCMSRSGRPTTVRYRPVISFTIETMTRSTTLPTISNVSLGRSTALGIGKSSQPSDATTLPASAHLRRRGMRLMKVVRGTLSTRNSPIRAVSLPTECVRRVGRRTSRSPVGPLIVSVPASVSPVGTSSIGATTKIVRAQYAVRSSTSNGLRFNRSALVPVAGWPADGSNFRIVRPEVY